jgi:predicted AlkP superfamily pyrophosphatase or phosphodiesterase
MPQRSRAFTYRVATWTLLLALFAYGFVWPGNAQTSPVVAVEHRPNSPAQQKKHYVILISMDGFRYDYAKRYNATSLQAMALGGASAPDGMIPSYPSVTFPNHYTLVTGLYPEHHGIVGNTFYDPARKEVYSYHDPATVDDGTWYGGTPLWVLAEEQGMRAACFFWPGSEADIQGVRPSYYARYEDHYPNGKRVQQVLDWLRLPSPERPHFITLYFSDTDDAGHKYGPNSAQVGDAVHELDAEVGALEAGIRQLKLPVDVIVVADHGMAATQGGWVNLDQNGLNMLLLEKIEGLFLYPKSEMAAEQVFESLEGSSDKFRVFRRKEVPTNLHFDLNPREGDPVIVATGPYTIRAVSDGSNSTPAAGNHGFDPMVVPEMKATFIAEGPDIRPGARIAPFENVDVYPFIARILGLDITSLKTGAIDGSLAPLQSAFSAPQARK